MKGKVSIITAVYNGEKYVRRYLDSIKKQTYKNIELIIIDDGSTDLTKQIITEFIKLNDNLNIKYLYKENGGQASAIAVGIKSVTGEYMVAADSDDFFEIDAIEKMVDFLEKNNQCDIVRGNAVARYENDISKIAYSMKIPKKYQKIKNIFEDIIFIRGINIFTGVYMVRFEKYKLNNPSLYIYESSEGQNWQLLLPATYNTQCGYIDEILYNYVVRNNSHSHIKRNLNENIERQKNIKNILNETLKKLPIDELYLNSLLVKVNEIYNRNIYILYCKNGSKEYVKKYYKILNKKDIKVKLAYFVGTNKLVYNIYNFFRGNKYD